MITTSQAGTLINRIMTSSNIVHTDGTPARITPHDFRRIFATEVVSAGLPVHIAAKILGHANLNTTQGYIAVYDHDVIEHHRAFISRRRQQRPSDEYRDVSDTEWDEFLDHFEHRKVELGTCGRAYATPCHHEHACIRCPLLRVDPRQRPRLQEIRVSLTGRLREAHERGWAREIDGLEVSLAAANDKLVHICDKRASGLSSPIDPTPPASPATAPGATSIAGSAKANTASPKKLPHQWPVHRSP